MRKFKKRWLLILVFISILSASAFNRRYKQVNAEEADTTEVTPYKKPTGDATKFLGIWLTSGYTLQPNENTYIEVGQTKTLSGNAGRSMLTYWATILYVNKKYQWYKSTDGKNWAKVSSKDSGDKKTMPVTPTEVGTTYYQLDTYFQTAGLIGATASHLYSNVATVHAVPEPVNAQKVTVTVDDDYLYNSTNDLVNIETVAHAHPDPVNFTGTVTWSISDTNLATIDEETGEITANTGRRAGVVTVYATLHNPDGSIIKGETDITIGGGLENQTVKAGETATFALQGNIGELDEDGDDGYTIKWYKEDPITHTRTQVQKDKPQALSYTIPDTTLDDDGTLIVAIISMSYGGRPYSYTTNDAYLYVTPEGGPDIEMTNIMKNETFDDGTNTDNMLFGVNNGDTVTYTDTVTNNSTSGTLTDATYTLPLHNNTKIASVQLDGKELSSSSYSFKKNDTTGATDLTIPGLNFKINESHKIQVNTTVDSIEKKETFSTVPYIAGKADGKTDYQKVGRGNTINYELDTITITNTEDIDYGVINAVSNKTILYRQDKLNNPYNIIDIDDTRRVKSSIGLYVRQKSELISGNNILSGYLEYHENGVAQDLRATDVEVSRTDDEQALSSQSWNKEEGVLLHMDPQVNSSGIYTTKLEWTIADSL
jgi:Bacterial Ig-like domain (group 2).